MPKPKGRPAKGRNDVTTRIDAGTLSKVKVVAGARKQTVAEYLTAIVDPVVNRDLASLATDMLKTDKPKSR